MTSARVRVVLRKQRRFTFVYEIFRGEISRDIHITYIYYKRLRAIFIRAFFNMRLRLFGRFESRFYGIGVVLLAS